MDALPEPGVQMACQSALVGIRLTHQTPMASMRKWKTILGT